jgi:methylaspartate mutase epsilon subunit
MSASLPCLRLAPGLPGYADLTARIRAQSKPTVAAVMANADRVGQVLVQPRLGVGGQREMQGLLRDIESCAAPDVLTLTIDSHTRLGYFERAREVLETDPTQLNGYPLVAHGWASASRIDAMLAAPLQVRHGSPDGRRLFAETVAAGLTSFEGGPIGYNIPYCKSVPLEASLAAWREIDELTGLLAADGIVVEREMFGSLSGVLVPPSVALSCVLVEALMAATAGCRSISLSVSQCGWIVQDVAMLRAARQLCRRYLPAHVAAHVVLHQFMGIFPREREKADAIIFAGGVVAALGGATKVITKTYQEAIGRPDQDANVAGVRLTKAAIANPFGFSLEGHPQLEVEQAQIESEVREIVDPLLQENDLASAVIAAFASGRLDVPFPASLAARGEVMPVRDSRGAVRFARTGALPFSPRVKAAATCRLDADRHDRRIANEVRESLFYFSGSGPTTARFDEDR